MSLGGSVFVQEKINVEFLTGFVDLIKRFVPEHEFFIIVGGGKTARHYQEVLKNFSGKKDDLDEVGIMATRLNASLVQKAFGDLADKNLIIDPENLNFDEKKIKIGGGWKPGRSTDYVATKLALTLGEKNILNLSNIDYVYDSDPQITPTAKPIEKMTFAELAKLVGNDWQPGANWPFDPIALNLAKENKGRVIFLNGKNLVNLEQYLLGQAFVGTVIER